MWQIGDKAVCVEAFEGKSETFGNPSHNEKPNGLPQKGTIYLVTGIIGYTLTPSLDLAGLPIYNSRTGRPSGWTARKFRKIAYRSEQIAETISNDAP